MIIFICQRGVAYVPRHAIAVEILLGKSIGDVTVELQRIGRVDFVIEGHIDPVIIVDGILAAVLVKIITAAGQVVNSAEEGNEILIEAVVKITSIDFSFVVVEGLIGVDPAGEVGDNSILASGIDLSAALVIATGLNSHSSATTSAPA